MPTYDYVCDHCQHEFEHFQSINDPVLKKCPECSKSKLRRLFGTGGAIVFKGSGFYQTDYRSESYKKGAAKESKGEGKSDSKKDGSNSSSNSSANNKSDASSSSSESATKKKSSSSE
ncbi:MAG: zinc ribbon domain-containing protein [Planctomycetales bacterium]|nr:zinc ribbon domain-containing protein [Planctomycetales bacterium]